MANGNIFGQESGVDLTAIVALNQNPFDIEGITYRDKLDKAGKWNSFQLWIRNSASPILIGQGVIPQGQRILNNPILNSEATGRPISNTLINIYNNLPRQTQFSNLQITEQDIKNIQEFHKKSDPKVQIDSWVGSQTSQLTYPLPTFWKQIIRDEPPYDYRAKFKTPEYIPVTWGNRRFIINVDIYDQSIKKDDNGKYSIQSVPDVNQLVVYDETKFGNKLQRYYLPKNWNNLDQSIIVNQSPNQVNQQTQQQQQQNQSQKQKTNTVNNITQPPR